MDGKKCSCPIHRNFTDKHIPGKYVGNRPVKLKKADDTAIRPVEIGHRKARQLERDLKKNRGKPY
jgi:hypothetical protein